MNQLVSKTFILAEIIGKFEKLDKHIMTFYKLCDAIKVNTILI